MREIDVNGVPVGGEPLRSRSEVNRYGYPGLRPFKGRVITEHTRLLVPSESSLFGSKRHLV
jgi:hypothetical protein